MEEMMCWAAAWAVASAINLRALVVQWLGTTSLMIPSVAWVLVASGLVRSGLRFVPHSAVLPLSTVSVVVHAWSLVHPFLIDLSGVDALLAVMLALFGGGVAREIQQDCSRERAAYGDVEDDVMVPGCLLGHGAARRLPEVQRLMATPEWQAQMSRPHRDRQWQTRREFQPWRMLAFAAVLSAAAGKWTKQFHIDVTTVLSIVAVGISVVIWLWCKDRDCTASDDDDLPAIPPCVFLDLDAELKQQESVIFAARLRQQARCGC